jgi:tRNA pseudouridine32 synthase/23S rRNA pseudouridine746 synthase
MLVWQSAHVVATDKPSGMLTIPGRRGASDPRPCLVRAVAARFPGQIWIVHRLDFEASGLVLFARSAEAHRVLCRAFEARAVRKVYEAWTEGQPPEPGDEPLVWESRLLRGRHRVHEAPAGKPSRTLARCLGPVRFGDDTLLRWELRPETGRPHQIRCQAAARGWPVAGDTLYGSEIDFGPERIALRAVALDLSAIPASDRARLEIPDVLVVPPIVA